MPFPYKILYEDQRTVQRSHLPELRISILPAGSTTPTSFNGASINIEAPLNEVGVVEPAGNIEKRSSGRYKPAAQLTHWPFKCGVHTGIADAGAAAKPVA